MAFHICPVCGYRHAIPAILDRLAYGRQLTCSPYCKSVFPLVARARLLARAEEPGQDGSQ